MIMGLVLESYMSIHPHIVRTQQGHPYTIDEPTALSTYTQALRTIKKHDPALARWLSYDEADHDVVGWCVKFHKASKTKDGQAWVAVVVSYANNLTH